MAEQNKPDYRYVWASGGAVVAPSTTKQQTGWVAEVPPYQWENWTQNRQDQMLVHINQHGIPMWDALTEYFAGKSYCLGSDGIVYKSVAASSPSTVTQDPTTDASDTYWTVAFASPGSFISQTQGDARYAQRANNLSDLANVATARTNLGAAALASPAFTGTPTAPTAAAGNSSTQIATTAFVNAGSFGTGQTYQDVTSIRTPGTTYTNSTGKAIFCLINFTGTNQAESATIYVDSFVVYTGDLFGTPQQIPVSFIVPMGASYRVVLSSTTIVKWSELR